MANVTYKASLRRGGKAGPTSKRVSVTVQTSDFDAIRSLADRRHLTIGGTAADLIKVGLKVAMEDANG